MQALRVAVAKNPLAALALVALAGILFADYSLWLRLPRVNLIAALLLGGLSLWRPRFQYLVLASFFSFAFVHTCRLEVTRLHPLHSILKLGQRVSFEAYGSFTRAPMQPEESGDVGRREARFVASKILLPTRNRSVVGETTLRVWLADPSFVPVDGQYKMQGTLYLIAPPWNPGGYNAKVAAERAGIVAECAAKTLQLECGDALGVRLRLLSLAESCREWIAAQVTLGIEAETMPATLITSMALGTSETASAAMQEPFRDSGTLHIFAVSGLHVGLLAIIGWMFLRPLGMPREWGVIILIPCLFGYAFITGWRPSAERSAVMTTMMLLAPVLNRQSRLVNGLGAAALLLWASDTMPTFQAGFQLSFGVLWAIAIGAEYCLNPLRRFTELDPFLPRTIARWSSRLWALLRRQIAAALATSLAAWAGSAPLMCYHFQALSPIAIVANIVLVPLAFVSLFIVALSILCGGLHLGWIQVCLNNANWLVAHAMMWSASGFSSIPGGHFPTPMPDFESRPPFALSVLSLPSGQGAQLLQCSGKNWMLDAGHADSYRRTLAPFLRNSGITQLDGLLLSHADSEHVGGASQLIEHLHPPQLYTSLHEPWAWDSPLTSLQQLLSTSLLTTHKTLTAGDSLSLGDARLVILYPAPGDLHSLADDRAVIARIDYGPHRLLWCNDAGFIAEKTLLSRLSPSELRCDILLRNQHSADFSALDEFIIAAAPRAIITSNTIGDIEQRLPARLPTLCRRLGIRLYDLSQTGTITVQAWPKSLVVKTWLTAETETFAAREPPVTPVP